MIQGDKGSVVLNGPPNICDSFVVNMNGQESQAVDKKVHPHRMYEEFCEFARMIEAKDFAKAKEMLEQSQVVMEIAEEALAGAGITLAGLIDMNIKRMGLCSKMNAGSPFINKVHSFCNAKIRLLTG